MESRAVAKVTPLVLVKVSDRAVSTYGFRHVLMEEHLREHLSQVSNQWCAISCLATTFYGRNTPANRAAMRARIPKAFKYFLTRGLVLAIEHEGRGGGHNGEAKVVKLYNAGVEAVSAERQCVEAQLGRMIRRRQLTEDQYQQACQIIGVQQGEM